MRQPGCGQAEDERAQPDARESLYQRRGRRAHASRVTQPNGDLQHDGRNDHDLDLDQHHTRGQGGIDQLPPGDTEQNACREDWQPAPGGALGMHNPLGRQA